MWWDTHFHLDSFAKKELIPELLEDAADADVHALTAIGGSDEANMLALDTARAHPDRLVCSVGYDRDLAPGWNGDVSALQALIHAPEVVAIGECGLDYFHNCGTREEQHRLFQANLDLALECRKPVVVHSREAEEDTLALLRDFSHDWPEADRPCAVLHCFTGDADFARQLVDLNILISFSGILTFKNAASLRDAAASLPDEALLVETDSPYLAPEPHRGDRNQPALVPHVGAVLADVRNQSVEDTAALTTRNATRLFGRNPAGSTP
jgi:TatD DNase family protein